MTLRNQTQTSILHVSIYPRQNECHSDLGGVAGYVKNLVEAIQHKISSRQYVVCVKTNEGFRPYKDSKAVILPCLERSALFWVPVPFLVRRIKPTVVHLQHEFFMYGGPVSAIFFLVLLFLLKNEVTVVTIHGVIAKLMVDKSFVKTNRSKMPAFAVWSFFYIIYKLLGKLATKIIVHEPGFRETLISDYKITSDKISVIPHGVEQREKLDRSICRSSLGVSAAANVVLFMGYAAGYKGIETLIRGFSLYAQQDKSAVLVIGAGLHPKQSTDPEYLRWYGQLRTLAEELIPKEALMWIGFVPDSDITRIYCAADLCVFPYEVAMSSSGPMALAMSYKLSFIAGDVYKEILPKKLLFKNTPECLSDKIKNFFSDPESYIEVCSLVAEKRSWNDVALKTINVYGV